MVDSNKNQFDPKVGSFGKALKPLLSNYSDRDIAFIEKAFNFARDQHSGQKRISGEPYFTHPLGVTVNIAKHKPDADTIAAALLHDVVEDCDVSKLELNQLFSPDVATLVDGVTKISSIEMKDKALGLEFSKNHFSTQIDSYRKLLTAMAGDPRVLIIKLYDRLYNAKTLEWLSENRRRFYALETIEIYAILAERVGMGEIKRELEDLCFPYAYPDGYKKFLSIIDQENNKSVALVEEKISEINKFIPKKLILDCYGRVKHKFSTFKKLEEKHYDFSDIYDTVALRIITENIDNCYQVLGIVNNFYQPYARHYHDFVAKPKANGYQSIHTTVKDNQGNIFEIQIRTPEMHEVAEFGIAAHWRYKELRYKRSNSKEVLSWSNENKKNGKFFIDKIFVFSPQGKIIELPKNATPLDFAFYIHTNLGLTCFGSRVNGKIVPISSCLKTGDVVEIIKNDRAKPSRDWLAFVKTNFARSKIREYFFDLDRPKYYQAGLTILNEELANFDKDVITEKNIKQFSNKIVDSRLPFNDLYTAIAAVGKRDISKNEIIKILYPEISFSEKKTLKRSDRPKIIQFDIGQGFTHRLANCCKPKDGDDILGYITLQKTITVHKKKCMEAKRFDSERIINAYWD